MESENIAKTAGGQHANLSSDKRAYSRHGAAYLEEARYMKNDPKIMRPAAIADRLKRIRLLSGLGKTEFAESVGIDPTNWSRFEGGKRAIPFEKAGAIAVRYGVTLDFIYLGRRDGLSVKKAEALTSLESAIAARSSSE